jgi:hypothetical protein
MNVPTKPTRLQTSLDILRLVALAVFAITWALPMYLSFFGPPRPSLVTGAIYPITIHGGVTYGTYWEKCVSSDTASVISIVLIGLNILLRRLYLPTHPF